MPAPHTVLHIPHASAVIPATCRASMLLSDEELQQELIRMTDWYTDDLFIIDPVLATPVVFPVSRLVTDVERFVDENLEPMAARGMGVFYTRTSGERLLRRDDPAEREHLLAAYYWPHHKRLTDAVQAAINDWGSCLIIDCHSFASIPLPHEWDQTLDRPDICIGTDEYHTPKKLASQTVEMFQKAGFRTTLNRPFAGALVPQAYYRRDPRVFGIMIELNRDLYTDEKSGERLPKFEIFRSRLQGILNQLIEPLNL